MIKFIYCLLIFLFFCLITVSCHDISKLKLVLVIQSHGDRTPTRTYPTDPYKDASYWVDGWGQLTNRGKDRMIKLGNYIRKRYDGYLGTSPQEVHIRSSAADRCFESAQIVSAAIYPPEGRWQWNKELGTSWQPSHIQTEPLPLDGMLNFGSICPAADEELAAILNSPAVKEYTNEIKDILKYVSDNTGLDVTDIITAKQLFDTLLVEKENNYPLPRWVNESIYKSLEEISDMTFYFVSSTKSIQRLRTGLLLENLSKHMREVETYPLETFHKLHIYSTDDTQLALLLSGLNVFNNKSPPFGSTIFIELHEIKEDHAIQVYYLNETQSENPYLLHLPNCVNYNNECYLGKFLDSIEQLIPIDWNNECHNDKDSLNSWTGTFITTVCVIGLLFILCIASLLYAYFKSERNLVEYQKAFAQFFFHYLIIK